MDFWGIGAPWLMRGRWRAGLVLAWRLQGPQIELSGWYNRQETTRCTDGAWFTHTMPYDIHACIPVEAFMRFLQDQQDVLAWAGLMVPKLRKRGRTPGHAYVMSAEDFARTIVKAMHEIIRRQDVPTRQRVCSNRGWDASTYRRYQRAYGISHEELLTRARSA